MWSVGNEPRSYRNTSGAYFAQVAKTTRDLDPTRCPSPHIPAYPSLSPSRPVTLVTNVPWDQDLASQHFDIIAINRYFGWYSDTG